MSSRVLCRGLLRRTRALPGIMPWPLASDQFPDACVHRGRGGGWGLGEPVACPDVLDGLVGAEGHDARHAADIGQLLLHEALAGFDIRPGAVLALELNPAGWLEEDDDVGQPEQDALLGGGLAGGGGPKEAVGRGCPGAEGEGRGEPGGEVGLFEVFAGGTHA